MTSSGDDPPTKPPRASWEPPEPDEAVPVATPPAASTSRPTPWTPPPPDELPRKKTARAQTKPPRASWETPDPDEPAASVSGSWTAEPPVVVASEPAPIASGSYASEPAPAASDAPAAPSGSYAQPSGAYAYDPASYPAVPAEVAPTASATVAAPRVKDTDDPLAPLPAISEDNTLRAAVGAKLVKERKKPPPPPTFDDDDDADDDDGDRPKRSRRMLIAMIASLVGVVGLGIGALVIFGNINKQRFLIACQPQEVHAQQGRGFPPWGERNLDDEGMWKPIKIPPEAECRERETEDQEELSRWYLEILVDRASSQLVRETRDVAKIDEAAAMLDQALLHARSPDRREQRREIERLLGDVGYWRASAKLETAASALSEAAKQFDAAAAQRPRHVSDASAWATYVRKLVDELRAGPNGEPTAFPPTPPTAPREPAPPGVALPVEPSAGSGSASEQPPAPPDAGLPTGGVLL